MRELLCPPTHEATACLNTISLYQGLFLLPSRVGRGLGPNKEKPDPILTSPSSSLSSLPAATTSVLCPVFWSPHCCWEFSRAGVGPILPCSELPINHSQKYLSSPGQSPTRPTPQQPCPPGLPSSHTGLFPAQDCWWLSVIPPPFCHAPRVGC